MGAFLPPGWHDGPHADLKTGSKIDFQIAGKIQGPYRCFWEHILNTGTTVQYADHTLEKPTKICWHRDLRTRESPLGWTMMLDTITALLRRRIIAIDNMTYIIYTANFLDHWLVAPAVSALLITYLGGCVSKPRLCMVSVRTLLRSTVPSQSPQLPHKR